MAIDSPILKMYPSPPLAMPLLSRECVCTGLKERQSKVTYLAIPHLPVHSWAIVHDVTNTHDTSGYELEAIAPPTLRSSYFLAGHHYTPIGSEHNDFPPKPH